MERAAGFLMVHCHPGPRTVWKVGSLGQTPVESPSLEATLPWVRTAPTQTRPQRLANLWLRVRASFQLFAAGKSAAVWARHGAGGRQAGRLSFLEP